MEFVKSAVAENLKNDPGTPYRIILSTDSSTPEERGAARARLIELSRNDVWWSLRKKFYGDLYTEEESLERYIDGKGFGDARERADARRKARLETEAKAPAQPASMVEASSVECESVSSSVESTPQEEPDFTASLPDFDVNDVLSEEHEAETRKALIAGIDRL